MVAKRNHFLPQCYLNAFVSDGESKGFWVYDKEGGAPRPQTPINTGVEGHLYTVLSPEGEKDDFIETEILAPLDGTVAPILSRWAEPQGEIETDDIPIIAEFLAFLHTRVPRHIEMVREFAKLFILKRSKELSKNREMLNSYLERYKKENPGEPVLELDQLCESFQNIEERFDVSMNKQAAMLFSFLQTQTVLEALFTLNWRLIHISHGKEFITCDAPLVSFVSDGQGSAAFGAGFLVQNVEVSFAVSPNSCLFLERSLNTRIVANASFVTEMNRRTAYMAERFVISRTKSEEAASLVKYFLRTRARRKLDRDAVFKHLEDRLK